MFLACLVRSLDSPHTSINKTHLIISCFYTDHLNIKEFCKNFGNMSDSYLIVII
jgi:hypothetical protein